MALRPRSAQVARRTDRVNTVTTRAAVEISVAYAVAQQDLFFAATVAGECLYQQSNLPADYQGRPEFSKILLPCGLLVGVSRRGLSPPHLNTTHEVRARAWVVG